jgi:hypothetical protein
MTPVLENVVTFAPTVSISAKLGPPKLGAGEPAAGDREEVILGTPVALGNECHVGHQLCRAL